MIKLIAWPRCPPDDAGAEVLDADSACYRDLLEAARRHLGPGRHVAGIWDRRKVDGAFWVAWSRRRTRVEGGGRRCS